MRNAIVAAIMLAGVCYAAPDLSEKATILLTLKEGIEPARAGDRYARDMELELTLRDGKFEPKVWGYAVGLQKCDHEGELVSADDDTLVVKMTLNRDAFGKRGNKGLLGTAEYRVKLSRDGDAYTGTFSGTVTLEREGQHVPQAVKGQVAGKAYPLWTDPPPGFVKLEPNEHPRLIFRKHDLPMIKRRLQTPEGKAIMARFLEQLPRNYATHPKCQPYFPAGYALAYQLTGDKAHADRAREILAGMIDIRGSQDIHFGPMAQAMAVTLDLCYDAWDADFRQKVIDNLAGRLSNLETLTGMKGASLNPWHNHEAIRACGAGVAAICLLGEKTGNGKEIPGLERIIHVNARSIRRFFQTNGNSNTGWGMEGDFYKRMTWNSGPGHMIQAYRTAMGGDMMAGWPGHWTILGEWMWQPPAEQVVAAESLRTDQDSGLFVLGLTTVPDSMKAGARRLFDRAYGLEGNRTFGLLWAYHAGYLLMNYPFDVAPEPPGKSLPWIAPDPTGGHWIFRKPWQGADDTLIVLNPHCDFPGGTHWIAGRSWDMQLFALGKHWVGDGRMSEKSNGPGAALPTVANPGAYNDMLGARCTDWSSTTDGTALLSFDMSPVYMQVLSKGARPAPGRKLVRMTRSVRAVDHGIRADRCVAVDLSGKCGAPVLFAVVDRFRGAEDVAWNLRLAEKAGNPIVEGNTVTVGDPAGPNMRVWFAPLPGLNVSVPMTKPVSPSPRRVPEFLRKKLQASAPKPRPDRVEAGGCDEYFAVITVQNGAAPVVKVEGEGIDARITVGDRLLRFDEGKLVLGKQ